MTDYRRRDRHMYDPEEAKRLDRPPIHFSLQDPWRDYRLGQHYAGGSAALVQPPTTLSSPSNSFPRDTQSDTAVLKDVETAGDVAATNSESANSKQVKSALKYRGVVWDISARAWRTKLKVKGNTWHLGSFKDDISAAKAYDAASYFVHGPGAKLNFRSADYSKIPPPKAPPVWLMDHLRKVKITFYEEEKL